MLLHLQGAIFRLPGPCHFYIIQTVRRGGHHKHKAICKEIGMRTMKKLNVLLVCGSGASSGFMAANMRKAAKARGLDMKITARSESEIENYIDEIDALMVGPHLAYIMDDIEEYTQGADVKVILMKPSYYSKLDGSAALDDLLSAFGE